MNNEMIDDYFEVDPNSSDPEQSNEDKDIEIDDDDDSALNLASESREPLHVLPLYSLLAPEEQQKVFESPPEGHRLCVIATNVAETSLTIPNIKYVIDSGKVKERHYDASTDSSHFQIEWCSKASATQRAGRAGRVGPGHCYRLYSSAVFESQFPNFAIPEIQRSSIDSLVLQLKSMGIDKPENFPLPSAPPLELIVGAQKTLLKINALDTVQDNVKITPLGRKISNLPVSPSWGRLLIISMEKGQCQYFAMALAAVLSVGDPFLDHSFQSEVENSHESPKQKLLELAGKPNQGDIFLWLNAFMKFIQSPFRDRRSICLRMNAMLKRMEEMYQQLSLFRKLMTKVYNIDDTIPSSIKQTDFKFLKQLLTDSLSDRVAERVKLLPGTRKTNAPSYRIISRSVDDPQSIAYLHPSSILFRTPPQIIVFMELLQNGDIQYLKYVTPIESSMLK